jgi:hypothetical protein
MEGLARGAMRFSRRFTVKELRERWRALLYDPEIAEQASLRMAEAEYTSNYCGPENPVEQKNPQELARKRRANSIRTLYYKRSKKVVLEDVAPDRADDAIESNADGPCEGSAPDDNPQGSYIRILPDATATELVDPSSMAIKEGHSPELEDGGFSQMYSLLATGGIKAVIAAIPAEASVNALEQEHGGPVGARQNEGDDVLPASGLAKFMGSNEDPTILQAENGQNPGSVTILGEHVEPTGSLVIDGTGLASESNAVNLRHSCPSVEDGSAITIADIKVDTTLPSSNSSVVIDASDIGPESNADNLRHSCPSAEEGSAVSVADDKVDITLPSSNSSVVIDGTSIASESNADNSRHLCPSAEEGPALSIADNKVDVTLPSSNCPEIVMEDFQKDESSVKNEVCEPDCAQEPEFLNEVHDAHEAAKQDHTVGPCSGSLQAEPIQEANVAHDVAKEDCRAGPCPASSQGVEGKQGLSGTTSPVDDRSIAGGMNLETDLVNGTPILFSQVEDPEPPATSAVSAVDRREDIVADIKVQSPVARTVDPMSSGLSEGTELLERSPTSPVDAQVKDELDEAETIEALYRECCCAEIYGDDNQGETGCSDSCCCTGVDEDYDLQSSCVLTEGPCRGDAECPYLADSCSLQQLKSGPWILQPSMCSINSEDMEVPSLEESLLPPQSPVSYTSDEGDMVDYADSPDADGSRDDFIYADELIGGIPTTDAEQMEMSARMETDYNNVYDASPALFGSCVDRSVGSTGVHPNVSADPAGLSLLGLEDDKLGLNCPGYGSNPGFCTSGSDLQGPYTGVPSQNAPQQFAPQENGGGGMCQEANNLRVTEWQPSKLLPMVGGGEAETLLNGDMLVHFEAGGGDGAALKSVQEPVEEEVESEEEMGRFSDIEAMVMHFSLDIAYRMIWPLYHRVISIFS